MAYLSREERREQIRNTAADILSRESLAAATVRRIAQETGCSLGQIHHHFDSAAALRAEAVGQVWARLETLLLPVLRDLPPRKRLLAILACSQDQLPAEFAETLDTAERLWKEVWDIRQEEPVRAAICEVLLKMRGELRLALEDGIAAGAFPSGIDICDVSMRLMAATHGYDLLEDAGVTADAPCDKIAFLERLLDLEGL
ncbi:TetR family transcriptional regulator [Seohaeicola zhoushanensis]|uniref:TetR family transcriptional regulator n=1 Tax=Seohaeicola zhoushanensis TaxID=1569283 RepID=A0A8J3MAE8_9RHOB|nr:TetR family transcriptional regulator [Seohaeicola zhoushanensis]GHF68950.1 TetR family transcriptional regulator [Seohaeicola zhoushanensis]